MVVSCFLPNGVEIFLTCYPRPRVVHLAVSYLPSLNSQYLHVLTQRWGPQQTTCRSLTLCGILAHTTLSSWDFHFWTLASPLGLFLHATSTKPSLIASCSHRSHACTTGIISLPFFLLLSHKSLKAQDRPIHFRISYGKGEREVLESFLEN